MRLKALCLLLVPILMVTACSRLTFVRPKNKIESLPGQQTAPEYSVGDSPDVKRRQSVQILLARAMQRLQSGEPDVAEKDVRAALKLDPGSVDAVTILAVIEDQRGHASVAGQHYRRAAELAPTRGAVQNNYGTWLCANGFAAESLVWFDRAIHAPGYATPGSAMANAGSCALKAGQNDRAAHDLREALASEPSNAVALEAMAELEFRRQQYLPARAFIERRLAAGPASVAVLKLASQIEERLGDRAAASRYVQRIRAEFPDAQDVTTGGNAGP
ncbi:type IV pilus biogenesis/stability protein PilW [Pseudoxanthomonas mexicana]|uniref:type IV pilus biogenesis/stability protein PilW n=1 Tax=Pseudoxanthomonas mexicana TaxID=128785 RepID=UPI000781952D|nr:type IV pilus biogenesis/stability protein PilW [Pseudoxanthomonas mexicana]